MVCFFLLRYISPDSQGRPNVLEVFTFNSSRHSFFLYTGYEVIRDVEGNETTIGIAKKVVEPQFTTRDIL